MQNNRLELSGILATLPELVLGIPMVARNLESYNPASEGHQIGIGCLVGLSKEAFLFYKADSASQYYFPLLIWQE